MTNVRILAQILEYNVKTLIMWFVDGTAKIREYQTTFSSDKCIENFRKH